MNTQTDGLGPTPILLITGFLGSGKTTLINRLLRTQTGAKLGVVVNEFGQIGIDGALLSTGDILELSDGCVCCARGTELWDAALSLVDRAGATHLIVETSGIAEPGVLLRQYEDLPEALRDRLDLRGLLCLVDVLHVSQAVTRRAEAEHQIREADRLLLTKLDLGDAMRLEEAHRLLDRLGATSDRVALPPDATPGDVAHTLRWALAPRMAGRAPAGPAQDPSFAGHDGDAETRGGAGRSGHDGHVGHDGHPPGGHGGQLCAVSLRETRPLLSGPLRQLLQELPGEVLRVKGFVRLADPGSLGAGSAADGDGAVALLELAGRRVELRPCTPEQAAKAPPGSTLVFIGEGLDEAWLRLRLSACRAG